MGLLLLGTYIPHRGLFHTKSLRQQTQRTLSTDRAVRKVMIREKEVCLGLLAGAGQLVVHSQSADTVQAQNEIVSVPFCPLCLPL